MNLDKIGKQRVAHAVMNKHRDNPNSIEEMLDMRKVQKILAENSIFNKDVAAVPEHKMDYFVTTLDANFLKAAIDVIKLMNQEQAAVRLEKEAEERAHQEAKEIRRELEEVFKKATVVEEKTQQEAVVEVVEQDPKEEIRQNKAAKKDDIDPDDMFEDLDDDFQKENVPFVPDNMRNINKSSKYDSHIPIVNNKKNSGKVH